jgi:hypothetical protein
VPTLIPPEQQIDPATLQLVTPGGEPDDPVAGAIELYRDFVRMVGVQPAQEGPLAVAIYLAQKDWLEADRAAEDRVLTAVASEGKILSDADRVQAAATHRWGAEGEAEVNSRSLANQLLVDRLRGLLTPQQSQVALKHPFLAEVRHLDQRLFVRKGEAAPRTTNLETPGGSRPDRL